MNPLEQFSIKGKIAVVLGGTSGIGQAIARGYAAAGATTIASSRDQAKVDPIADEIEKLGSKTLRLTSDVQDRASQAEALLFAQRQYAVPMSFLLKPPHQRAQPHSHDHVGQPLSAKGFRLCRVGHRRHKRCDRKVRLLG